MQHVTFMLGEQFEGLQDSGDIIATRADLLLTLQNQILNQTYVFIIRNISNLPC